MYLGNMTLVYTVCKTDRFVSCHSAKVAKTEQNVFVIVEICVQTMITGKPVVSIIGKLLVICSGLLFNTAALKSTTSTKEIRNKKSNAISCSWWILGRSSASWFPFPRYTGRSNLWKETDLLCICQGFNRKLKTIDLIPLYNVVNLQFYFRRLNECRLVKEGQ